jgi:acyl-CoA oxidase
MAADAAWQKEWSQVVASIRSDVSYQDSAKQLRNLIKTGLLKFTDVKDAPDKFFLAHRMLVGLRGPGFWIRFTVQYNLFAGTVLGLGGPEQVAQLATMQQKGQLGCFGLTEKLAGVNSGLVVQTTATWDKAQQAFILDSPTEGSHKNWISQGLTAEKAAVIADLRINGKSFGPHGFLVDMRSENGTLLPGVVLGDMGRKTTGNDLDNAWIKFDQMVIPKSALLNRFAEIQNDQYVQTTKEKMRIEVIGQRLLTGRVAVAQAALQFTRNLYAQTKQYTSKKKCWSPGGDVTLGSIAHIEALYVEAEKTLSHLEQYTRAVEAELSKCLVQSSIPPASLVQAIAVGKISAVEHSIALSFRLKQEVGSYALMGGTGFDDLDFLQCCKFAEGDSRILMQKLARDQVRVFSQFKSPSQVPVGQEKEAQICRMLQEAGKEKWDGNWALVYDLSNAIQARIISEWTGGKELKRALL